MASGFVGVLMLDTAFARPVGDIGNRNSFPGVPMRFARVRNAFANRVLDSDPKTGLQTLFPAFLQEALSLQAQGALGITTSCGFLAPLQHRLAMELAVPVALSSLLQVAWAQSLLPPGKICGVITIDAERLSLAHLISVGAAAETPIVGMPRCGAFAELVLGESMNISPKKDPNNAENYAENYAKNNAKNYAKNYAQNYAQHDATGAVDQTSSAQRKAIETELIAAARRLPSNTGAIVLECTNLPPYRQALRRHTQLPIYDIETLIRWFWAGLRVL